MKEMEVREMLYGKLTLLKEPGLSNVNQLQDLHWELEAQTDRGDWLHFDWEMADPANGREPQME